MVQYTHDWIIEFVLAECCHKVICCKNLGSTFLVSFLALYTNDCDSGFSVVICSVVKF